MLDIDTNVLVRFLVRDEPKQFERARQLIKREVGTGETALISLLVLLERVLRSRYGMAKQKPSRRYPRYWMRSSWRMSPPSRRPCSPGRIRVLSSPTA